MAAAWFAGAARGLARGYAVVIDYGYPAAELYSGHRLGGLLRGYAGHTVTDDPFVRIGNQDLTAHVDFTALEEAGKLAGLSSAGLTTQGAFLSSLGLGDLLLQLTGRPRHHSRRVLRRPGRRHAPDRAGRPRPLPRPPHGPGRPGRPSLEGVEHPALMQCMLGHLVGGRACPWGDSHRPPNSAYLAGRACPIAYKPMRPPLTSRPGLAIPGSNSSYRVMKRSSQ